MDKLYSKNQCILIRILNYFRAAYTCRRLLFTGNMKRKTIQPVILFFIAAFLNSCIGDATKQPRKNEMAATALDLDQRLKAADSLVVVFYKDPYGEDALRYTRYYTQISVTDTFAIAILKQQLAQPYTKEQNRRKCRGEGKIGCYTKAKIFQTLYFSTFCDTKCCYVYLIKNGNFYYTPILQVITDWLESLKPLTIEPKNEAADGNGY